MRTDPLYLAWEIHCSTPQDASRIKKKMVEEIDVDRVLTIEIQSGGVSKTARHRIGDYFETIQILPEINRNESTIRLVFHRRPEADRFWKDVMARVIRAADETGRPEAIKLTYRGNDSL